MDRAHRLGQKRVPYRVQSTRVRNSADHSTHRVAVCSCPAFVPLQKVFVYRLITESTIEEKIIERAEIKLRLDAMVIQQGRQAPKGAAGKGAVSSDDVSSMIRLGADRIFRQKGSTVTDADIDAILLAGEQRTRSSASDSASTSDCSTSALMARRRWYCRTRRRASCRWTNSSDR